MALDSTQVVVAADGRIRVAPVGTADPTDVETAYDPAWLDLGFATEDGVTLNDSKTIEAFRAWQALYPIRRVITERDFTLSFQLLQWNADTVPFAFGGGEVSTTGVAPDEVHRFDPPAPAELDERALSVEWFDGDKTYRLFVARGLVMEAVESNLTRSDMSALPISFGAIAADETTQPWHLITSDPAFAAS
ncbi:MAG: phage tail protein [Actinobacteria bacterium]|nr:phage tail protein [Actinomycetota bacterium]